ncbi:hypothetical protein NM688_g8174 [Phlebia brevispora]|uniref:Uncharacterized protein n=1 Tax=Phlebia brevispora TaxID=194682 RepID=A0ACC1RWB4_9APHY|nr:hypothetical protein NM688_g8174 [Phlebia brevispora]
MPLFLKRFKLGSNRSKEQDRESDNGNSPQSKMATTKSAASELRALADLINGAVAQIEAACASRSQTYPLADEPFTPQSEAARMSPDVLVPGNIIVAAAAQLITAVRIPALTLSVTASSSYLTSSLRLAISTHVPEILREAGPQGLHAKEIASKTTVDPIKLARALRLLTTHHIFREVAPDVFTNNRVSSLIDTGKPVADILAHPENKFDGTSGIAAVLEHVSDEGLKSSGWLAETIMDEKFGPSQEPNETAFNKAYNTPLPVFPWWELPENALRLKRFGIGMQGTQNMASPGAILEGYGWKDLPKGSVVVDVGGGVGSHSLVLAKAHEHLEFVVQDRDAVITDAVKYWDAQFPAAVKGNRVKLQAHDFFTPQPVKAPAVFLLRMVLHDWSDKYASLILKQLRGAAGPDTQLLVVDNTIEYACEDTTSARDIPGAVVPLPPAPLLANKGAAGALPYFADLHMMSLCNGDERTVSRFQKLLQENGWKLTKVIHVTGFEVENAKLVAVPI